MREKRAFIIFVAIFVFSCTSAKLQNLQHSCDADKIKERAKNQLGFSDILQCLQDSNLDPCNLPQSSSQLSAQQNKVIYDNCAGPMAVMYHAVGMDSKLTDNIQNAQKDVHRRKKRIKSNSSPGATSRTSSLRVTQSESTTMSGSIATQSRSPSMSQSVSTAQSASTTRSSTAQSLSTAQSTSAATQSESGTNWNGNGYKSGYGNGNGVGKGNGGGADLEDVIAAFVQNILRILPLILGFISQCIDAVGTPSDISCILSGIGFGVLAGPALPAGR